MFVFKNIGKLYSTKDYTISKSETNNCVALNIPFNSDAKVYFPTKIASTLVANNCGFKNKILDYSKPRTNKGTLSILEPFDQVSKEFYLSETVNQKGFDGRVRMLTPKECFRLMGLN